MCPLSKIPSIFSVFGIAFVHFCLFLYRYYMLSNCIQFLMFLLLKLLLEYWIEHFTVLLLNVKIVFAHRNFYRVAGFATDCPCGVWCRGFTTCLLYVGPLFGNLVKTAVGPNVWHSLPLILYIYIYIYLYLVIQLYFIFISLIYTRLKYDYFLPITFFCTFFINTCLTFSICWFPYELYIQIPHTNTNKHLC